LTES
jgi:hypothetical protein